MEAITERMPSEGSVEAAEYFAILRRRWRVVLAVTLIGLLAALGYVAVTPKSYTATAAVSINPITLNPFDNSARIDQLVNASNELQVMTSSKVAERAAKILGTTANPASLLKQVSVIVPPNSQVLSVSYAASSAAGAAAGANAFAVGYLQFRGDTAVSKANSIAAVLNKRIQALQSEITIADTKIALSPPSSAVHQDNLIFRDVLTKQVGDLRTQEAALSSLNVSPGDVIQTANPPGSPSAPKIPLIVAAGAVLGLLAGLVIAFVRDRRDRTVKNPADLSADVGAPVLAIVPAGGRHLRGLEDLVALSRPDSVEAEMYRRLRAKLLIRSDRSPLHSLLILGGESATRRVELGANLAVSLAQTGQRVVLLSLDAEEAPLHDLFRVGGDRGLANVLLDGMPLSAAVQPVGHIPNLAVLPTGQSNDGVTDAIAAGALRTVVSNLRDYDLVIMVGPPVAKVGDVLPVAAAVDGVLVAAEQNRTSGLDLGDLSAELRQVGAPLVGSTLITRRSRRSGRGRPAVRPALPTPGGSSELPPLQRLGIGSTADRDRL